MHVQRIDRYEIVAELGRGAMGVVYKAWDPELERTVAIKTVRSISQLLCEQDADLQRSLHREAAAVARLNHPNIVAVHDAALSTEAPYIVMEYVEGPTLADLIAAGPLAPDNAVHVVRQICEALYFAHGHAVVHRDIKTTNILVAENGVAKLTDFGIARVAGNDATQTGVMLGTPAYMAPEQVRGLAAGPRSDLFALGVVLYEAVTGVNPFQRDDVASVLYEIVHRDPVPARQRNARVSPALDTVIRRAMSKEPEQRYPTALALGEALAQALEQPAGGVSNRGGTFFGFKVARPRAALIGAGSVLLGGMAVSVVWGLFWGPQHLAVTAPERPGVFPIVPAAATSLPSAVIPDPSPPGGSETGTPVRPVGVISIRTNPAVEVFLDDDFKGRAGRDPLIIPDCPIGKRALTLRFGSRVHTLQGIVREGETIAFTYYFPDAERAPVTLRPLVPADEPSGSLRPATPPELSGCVSINAVPFAGVYVDGRHAADTPRACLRVPIGERRVYFRAGDERSPERLLEVTERHTAENPLRLSYNFKLHRFLE
jgi:hypothetical protein